MDDSFLPADLLAHEVAPHLDFSTLLSFLCVNRSLTQETRQAVDWLRWFSNPEEIGSHLIEWTYRGIAHDALAKTIETIIPLMDSPQNPTLNRCYCNLMFYYGLRSTTKAIINTVKFGPWTDACSTRKRDIFGYFVHQARSSAWEQRMNINLSYWRRREYWGFYGREQFCSYIALWARNHRLQSLARYFVDVCDDDDLMAILNVRSCGRQIRSFKREVAIAMYQREERRMKKRREDESATSPGLETEEYNQLLAQLPLQTAPFVIERDLPYWIAPSNRPVDSNRYYSLVHIYQSYKSIYYFVGYDTWLASIIDRMRREGLLKDCRYTVDQLIALKHASI